MFAFILATLELSEEADVVLGEEAEVLDSVFEVGDTLHAHSEGKTAVLLRINAAGL